MSLKTTKMPGQRTRVSRENYWMVIIIFEDSRLLLYIDPKSIFQIVLNLLAAISALLYLLFPIVQVQIIFFSMATRIFTTYKLKKLHTTKQITYNYT